MLITHSHAIVRTRVLSPSLPQADEEQSYRTNMIKLIDNLVKYHQEGMQQERALNEQLAALFHAFMQLIQQAAAQPAPPPVD